MLAYVKDFVRDEWNSKQAILSMGIAGHIGGHYYSVPGPWRVVTHLADGRDFTPRGVSPGMCVAIVHDSMEYPGLKRMPVRIGLGDIPGCTENLASFPLAAGDMVRRPVSERYDAVIGGRVDGTLDDIGAIVDRAGLSGKRVAIAVAASPDAVGQISAQLGARLNGVEVIGNPDLPVMTALYSTCPTVVHLGHCARGYLHAYAMYHTEVEGRELVERVPGERYTPSRIEELVRLLAQWK